MTSWLPNGRMTSTSAAFGTFGRVKRAAMNSRQPCTSAQPRHRREQLSARSVVNFGTTELKQCSPSEGATLDVWMHTRRRKFTPRVLAQITQLLDHGPSAAE